MKILFWNTHRNKHINPYIVSLVHDYQIDILVTAEYRADKNELDELFKEQREHLVVCNTHGCSRIDVWSSYVDIEAGMQEHYYSMQIIQNQYILCCVHLFSDLHGNRSDERLGTVPK